MGSHIEGHPEFRDASDPARCLHFRLGCGCHLEMIRRLDILALRG